MISIASWQTLLRVTFCQMLQQMTESEKLGDTYFDVSHLVYDKFQLISQYPLVFFTQVPLLGLKCFMFLQINDLHCFLVNSAESNSLSDAPANDGK